MAQLVESHSTTKWLYFKEDLSIPGSTIFQTHKSAFGLGIDDQMILKNSHIDELSNVHYFFQQQYQGIMVEDGRYIVHEKQNRADMANGILILNLNTNVIPSISESSALQIAMSISQSPKFAWQDSSYVAFLRETSIDTSAPLIYSAPKGELLLTLKSDTLGGNPFENDFIADNYVLAYKFTIRTLDPVNEKIIYVNALGGTIIKQIDNLRSGNCHSGSVQTWYNGQQSFDTKRNSALQYRLIDECRHITTVLYDGAPIQIPQDIPTDSDNDWSSVSERPATSAHWAGKVCFDYFKNVHSRPGMNGNFYDVRIIANYSWSSGNHIQSMWEDPVIYCGKGDNTVAWHLVSLNIIGHEWTHGVIQFTAGLGGNGEAGALEESFCDIFGEMIESTYSTADWLWAREVFETYTPGGVIAGRSLSNPKDPNMYIPGPDTYGSILWNSMGDIHQRAGVQNKFFYLLCEGGNGTNDIGNDYCVEGLGVIKGRGLAYHTLVSYLSSNATFNDARTAWINATISYYGQNSFEVQQVMNAWHAVGVGLPFTGTTIYNNLIVSNTQNISHNNDILFNNLQVTPSGNLTVTSSTKITMNPTSKASSGSYFHAYITPSCPGGGMRLNNEPENNNSNNYSESDNANIDGENKINDTYSNGNIILTPNPTQGQFLLDIKNSQRDSDKNSSEFNNEIFIYDLLGNVIYQTINNKKTTSIDLSLHPQGIYFIKVQSADNLYTEKIILQ
mgnify:CR=1 FL=1